MYKLIDFYADWCGPCQALKPVLHKVATDLKEKMQVEEINVDSDPDKAQKFSVMSIPTLVILDKDGKEVDRKMGAMPESQLRDWLSKYI